MTGKPSTDWIHVLNLEDVPVLGARVVEGAAIGSVAVFRTEDDQVFALRDHCPHRGGPLSQGLVFGHRVSCPLHGWQIDLESGKAQAPDVGCARKLSLQLEGNQIFLYKPQLDGNVP